MLNYIFLIRNKVKEEKEKLDTKEQILDLYYNQHLKQNEIHYSICQRNFLEYNNPFFRTQ